MELLVTGVKFSLILQTRKSKQATEVVSEQFLKKVSDRLAGIKQDRDRMQKAVQDQACRKGQQVEDIQVWMNTCMYL